MCGLRRSYNVSRRCAIRQDWATKVLSVQKVCRGFFWRHGANERKVLSACRRARRGVAFSGALSANEPKVLRSPRHLTNEQKVQLFAEHNNQSAKRTILIEQSAGRSIELYIARRDVEIITVERGLKSKYETVQAKPCVCAL